MESIKWVLLIILLVVEAGLMAYSLASQYEATVRRGLPENPPPVTCPIFSDN